MNICKKIESFYDGFSGEKGIIGFSAKGNPIYYFAVTKSQFPIIIVQGAIHAREHITALLILRLIERFLLEGKRGSVYFIPAVNPDGIKISENLYPLFKANARGVDLNVNFDARWGSGKSNTFKRGQENYIGKYPFSESETCALRDFTLLIKPNASISYHSKGEEIYYEFFQPQDRLLSDYNIAKAVALATGYNIKSTPNSAGGYKDWCIDKLKIPALTIEVGDDRLSHPISEEYLEEIYQKNKGVLDAVIEAIK